MDEQTDTVQLECERAGSKFKVTARLNGKPEHIDTLDPANAAHRERFVKALRKKLDAANPDEINAELLRVADTCKTPPSLASGSDDELDISHIVRPGQFITTEVAGLAVPTIINAAGRPIARWMLYLRWADGRREHRELSNCIDLSNGSKLWIHPTPGEPSVSTSPGWSIPARRAWLDGAPASDPADLFKRICERIAYFIDLQEDVAAGTTATIALWSMLTYIYQVWDAVPYMYIGGPLGSGKTRLFEIAARLVYRPLQSSNLTAPALFRTLHDRGGVVLYDEAERLRQSTPEAGEILSMLLAGYKRGGQATRLEPVGDTYRPVAFDVYGPKALACIGGLPPALSSRCIPVTMFRAGPDSPKPKRRIDADPQGWQQLRDGLHVLALEHGATWLDLSKRSSVCPGGVNARAYELWQPLLALAWWVESNGANGLLSLMQRHALASIATVGDDQIPEADEILLEILTEAVRSGQRITPGEILDKARERAPATFGKSWQPNTVSKRLKQYGIPSPCKSNGRRIYRDVTLEMLWRIQLHYGVDLEIEDPTPKSPTLTDPADPELAFTASGSKVNRVGKGQ